MRIVQPVGTAALAVALFAMAGCGKKPEDSPMPAKPFVGEGVTMSLDPAAAPSCNPKTVYRATLSWTLEGKDRPRTEVRIDRPSGAVFARGELKDTRAETGDWVRPGTWFLLFDRGSGDLIGAVQAGPAPCP